MSFPHVPLQIATAFDKIPADTALQALLFIHVVHLVYMAFENSLRLESFAAQPTVIAAVSNAVLDSHVFGQVAFSGADFLADLALLWQSPRPGAMDGRAVKLQLVTALERFAANVTRVYKVFHNVMHDTLVIFKLGATVKRLQTAVAAFGVVDNDQAMLGHAVVKDALAAGEDLGADLALVRPVVAAVRPVVAAVRQPHVRLKTAFQREHLGADGALMTLQLVAVELATVKIATAGLCKLPATHFALVLGIRMLAAAAS